MKINITGHETTLTPEIKKYVETKINKLCKRYKQIISADVVVEENHNKTEKTAATVKVLLKISGQDVTASSSAKTIFAAIDETERKLVRQLDKEKTKYNKPKRNFKTANGLFKKFFSKDDEE